MRTVIVLFAGAMLTSASFGGDARLASDKRVHSMAVSVARSPAPVADGFGTEERFRLKYGRTLASMYTPASPRQVAAQCCKHAV